jgi:DNA-binding CsgD family transcriptional regulator
MGIDFNNKARHFLTILLLVISSQTLAQETNTLEYGTYLLEKNLISKAEETFQSVLSEIPVEERFDAYYEIAKLYNTHLYFDLSIEYCLEGVEEKGVDDRGRKRLLQLIVINHIDLNNLDEAEAFFRKSKKHPTFNDREKSNDYNLIGEISRLQNKSYTAIDYFKKAISINKGLSNYEGLAMNYNNLGLVYLTIKDYDKTQEYLNLSLEIIDSLGLKFRKMSMGISFGRLFQEKKEYSLAIESFQSVTQFDLTDHSDKTELLRDAYKGLFESYEAIDNSILALKNYKLYQNYENQIYDLDRQASIYQSQILAAKRGHEEEIRLLKEKSAAERKLKNISIVLLGVGIVLISVLAFLFKLRNKSIKQKIKLNENDNRIQLLEIENTKVINEKLQAEIKEKEQTQRIEELELQKLKETIDAKNRELTSFAIHISNKNEILSEVNQKIKSLDSWEENRVLKELNILIKQNMQLDQDWDIFKKHFIEVHPSFFETIIQKYPALTNDDLKLCAYLKIQLSSKEIARLLNIETSAINKRRNRIRKKLTIDSSIDLHEFMLTIDKA